MEEKLEVGKIYRIVHERKGTFVAQLIGIEPTSVNDSQDEMFLTMKYDVRAGTGQVGLAISPGKDSVRVSNLRPSLITHMEVLDNDDYKVKQTRVPKEKQIKKKPKGALDMLKHAFGKIGEEDG